MSRNKQRHQLYRDYLNELEQISGEPFDASDAEKKRWCSDYFGKTYYHWIDIIYDTKIVGFLIIAEEPDCHPDCDYFIAQSYVKPKFRKKHLMTNAIHKFITEHRGSYCLAIIDSNDFAYQFWFQLFKDLCYMPKTLDEVPTNFDEQTSLYGFEPT